jgi:Phosphotransferase enzyme family
MGEVVTAGSPRHRVPVSCNPVDHPVVSAWRRLAPARMRIDGVDLLRKKEKSAVYRLSLDNGATRVIAKRGWRERLLVERTIYESVLPHLAVPALRSYGFVGEEDEELAWLFIEDAGDVLFSLAQHETLVGRWLGALHGGAAALDPAPSLPERGPGHYLEHLDAVRTKILGNFDNPALRADDRGMLQRLVSACELIESNWSGVEKICDGLPRTLVHGDLGRKNLRLRHDEAGTAIVAFDWECSGWGIPAADIYLLRNVTRQALPSYRSAMSEYTHALDDDQIRLLLLMAKGFRLLACADWASSDLSHIQPQAGVATLYVYEQPLREWGEGLAASHPLRR